MARFWLSRQWVAICVGTNWLNILQTTIVTMFFSYENVWISNKTSLKYVHEDPIDTEVSACLGNGLASNRRQNFVRTNVYQDHWHHMPSPGNNELMRQQISNRSNLRWGKYSLIKNLYVTLFSDLMGTLSVKTRVKLDVWYTTVCT